MASRNKFNKSESRPYGKGQKRRKSICRRIKQKPFRDIPQDVETYRLMQQEAGMVGVDI